jgi:tRNA (guanine-N7-)-methyltransferase
MGDDDSIELELGVPIPGAVLPRESWSQTALKELPSVGQLDWIELFGRAAPVVLDLGCGNGRFLTSSAVRRPHLNHLGVDTLPVVVRYATRRGNQRGLTNVRVAVIGAHELLEQYVPPTSVREIHIYHPQPYRDPQKQQLRLLTPDFFALAHRCLEPEGTLFLQTDNPGYWKYMLSVVPAFFAFHEQLEPWPEDPLGRTRREILARQQGLKIHRAWAARRNGLTGDEIQQLLEHLPRPRFDAERPGKRRGKRRGK